MMKKVCFFIVVFLIINWLLGWGYSHVMEKSQLMRSHQEMVNSPNQISNLVLGTSHSLAIQSRFFTQVTNVASYAEPLHNTYYKLNYITNKLSKKPDTIFLSYDLGLLKTDQVDQQHHQFYWNKLESTIELSTFSDDLIQFWMSRVFAWLFPYQDGEVEVFDYFFAERTISDGEQLRGDQRVIDLLPNAKRKLDNSCLENQFSPYGEFYFRKILSLSKEVGAVVVLVCFPVTEHFYFSQSECFDPNKYYNEVNSRILNEFTNVIILDYHADFENSSFRDPHHLKSGNPRVVLTKMIVEDLKMNRHE